MDNQIQLQAVIRTHCKKYLLFSCPQPGCHLPNSPWAGIIKLFPARRESLVSDIPAGDGKTANLFLQCTDSQVLTVRYRQTDTDAEAVVIDAGTDSQVHYIQTGQQVIESCVQISSFLWAIRSERNHPNNVRSLLEQSSLFNLNYR
jgi:hypothetical protein